MNHKRQTYFKGTEQVAIDHQWIVIRTNHQDYENITPWKTKPAIRLHDYIKLLGQYERAMNVE